MRWRAGHAIQGIAVIVTAVLVSICSGPDSSASAETQDARESTPRRLTVTARQYRFDPPQMEVDQDDLVQITFTSADIAHSFTIDAYRLAKRADPGHPVTFEFRADRPGAFPIYCNLQIDSGCRRMRGELIVHRRRPLTP